MGNELNFSLGLAAGGFLANAARAQSAITGLASHALALPGLGVAVGGLLGSVGSLHAVLENTFAQFEKGAGLAALSKQSGESVRNLFLIEKGFKGVHLSADLAGTALFQMQKALGGFNEFGEPTKDIFASLGLNVEALKKAQAPEQFERIGAALAKLNSSEAANAASKIFGRGTSRDMLQLARSSEEFAAAMKAAAPQADIFARNAGAFERIEQAMNRLKGRTQGLFLGLAEGIAPSVQAALNTLNQLDLTGIGQRLGTVFAGLAEAVRQSKVGEVLELSLKAAIKSASDFFKGELFASGGILGKIQELAHAAKGGLQEVFLGGGPISQRGTFVFNDIFASALRGVGIGGTAAPNPFAEQLAALLASLAKDAFGRSQAGDLFTSGTGKLGQSGDGSVLKTRGDVSAFERIGLAVFGQSRQADYARQTARATQESSIYLKNIDELMRKRSFSIDDPFTNT